MTTPSRRQFLATSMPLSSSLAVTVRALADDVARGMLPPVTLPNGVGTVRVIAGEFRGETGPASTFTPISVSDLQLGEQAKVEIEMPEGHTCVFIVKDGNINIHDERVKAVELVQFERSGSVVTLESKSASRVLAISGEPIGEPVAGQGPFVMNSPDEIRQAIQEYQAGKMGHLN